MFLRKITIVTLLLLTFVVAKSNYRPPLVVENVVSDEVRAFLEKTKKNEKLIKKSNHDLLGRKKTGNVYPTNYVIVPEETMEVDVAYLGNHKPSAKISGRYEYDGDTKKFWFNGKTVSESEYFELFSNSQNKTFRNSGFRKKMSASEIESLLSGPQKVFIQKAEEYVENDFVEYSVILGLSEISTHAHVNNYKGDGIGIYFDENGCPHSANVNASYYTQVSPCPDGELIHPTGVAKILQKTAPEARIYGFGLIDTIPNPYLYTPNIVIASHSWSKATTAGEYSTYDARYDSYVYDERVTNFFAAGNRTIVNATFKVSSPAIAPNVIAVGAVDPVNFSYMSYSKRYNSTLGNQKPEIGNYAEFIFSDAADFTPINGSPWNKKFNGTSAAAPYTAGLAADIFSQHPFFIWHPEVVKALFLSSEKTPIVNADAHDADNVSIAKKIPTYSSMAWNHRVAYWNDDNDCCFDTNHKITFVESGIQANSHYRIAIAWLTNPDYIVANESLSQDIDLFVYQNNQLIAFSNSSNDPFEMVDFTTSSNSDLTIVIYRFANSGDDDVILGYSFWNDI